MQEVESAVVALSDVERRDISKKQWLVKLV